MGHNHYLGFYARPESQKKNPFRVNKMGMEQRWTGPLINSNSYFL